jgi:NADH-quinone oxidoreductase subunit E
MAPDLAAVDRIITSHGKRGGTLIAILSDIQKQYSYLPREALRRVAQSLAIPESQVFGVSSFYKVFSLTPRGKHSLKVCRGTACHVKGSAKVLDMVSKALRIEPGKTTRDKLFSLEVVACMGACGLAPVVNINGQFYAKVTPMKLQRIIEECRAKERANAK